MKTSRWEEKAYERFLQIGLRYRKGVLSRVKSRAKRNGIAFDLTLEDIVIPSQCPVLGLPLLYGEGKGYYPNSPSVDRINPAKGYTKGNVRVISMRANLLKSDATLEEIEKVYYDLKNIEMGRVRPRGRRTSSEETPLHMLERLDREDRRFDVC